MYCKRFHSILHNMHVVYLSSLPVKDEGRKAPARPREARRAVLRVFPDLEAFPFSARTHFVKERPHDSQGFRKRL